MSFTVTKLSQGPVVPAEPTPGGTLPLAWIDRYPTHRGPVESIDVFRHGREPGKVIKEAIGKALVYYYPLAGRIVDSDIGEAEVLCTGNGIWFVEASADCSLEDVNYLDLPLMIPSQALLPDPHPDIPPADTIMMIQVTEFTCTGFAIGIKFNHACVDGFGEAKFLTAVSEFARGLLEPITKPVWNREDFPVPTSVRPKSLPELPLLQLEYAATDVSVTTINKLKNQFTEQTGRRCSSFDVLVATVWQSRACALNLDPTAPLLLCFFASTRHLLNLGDGYYGNCIFPVKVSATSGEVAGATLNRVVGLIRDAKGRLPDEFAAWASGKSSEDPFLTTFSYNESLFVSDWSRLGFAEIDYGWGTPMYTGPMTNNDYIASCIILKSPKGKEGTRLMTRCVEKKHLEAFNEQMNNLA